MKYQRGYLSGEIKRRIRGCSLPDKDKLLEAIIAVFKRIPEEDVAVLLSERDLYFITPETSQAIPFSMPGSTSDSSSDSERTLWIILLGRYLEKKDPKRITYTIACELAHCFLEVTEDVDPQTDKINTDAQLVRWGFQEEVAVSKTYPILDEGHYGLFVTSGNGKQSYSLR